MTDIADLMIVDYYHNKTLPYFDMKMYHDIEFLYSLCDLSTFRALEGINCYILLLFVKFNKFF